MKIKVSAVIVMVIIFCLTLCVLGWAGDKEELQLKLEKAILTLTNAQLQFQLKMADDPAIISARQHLQAVSQDITSKGYEVKQSKDGKIEVIKKEPTKK